MNISFESRTSIRQLKKVWKELIDEHEGKIYLTWSYNRACFVLFRIQNIIRSVIKRKISEKAVFFTGREDNRIVFIFPAVTDSENKKIYFLASQYSSGSGYNDFISGDVDKQKIWEQFTEYLKDNYPGYTLSLHDIEETSAIPDIVKERPCVRIDLNQKHSVGESVYSEWYESLSKNARQNLRTAYNRINTDGKNYRLLTQLDVPFKLKWKLYLIYRKRSSQINNEELIESVGFFKKIRLFFDMQFNIVFYLLNRNRRFETVILLLDDRVSAFMVTVREKESVTVPKLAIDTVFSRYSPGCVLISEYIKSSGGLNSSIDLSRGKETYKTTLGGNIYYNYCKELDL